MYTYLTPWLRASLSKKRRHRTSVRLREDRHIFLCPIFFGYRVIAVKIEILSFDEVLTQTGIQSIVVDS